MKKMVRVKILDMSYEKDHNLFKMKIEELVGDHKKLVLAISGKDMGISNEVPIELINDFCKEIKGKEKNLYIEIDNSSIRDAERNEEGKIPPKEMERINDNIDNYPINEIMNNLNSEENANDD